MAFKPCAYFSRCKITKKYASRCVKIDANNTHNRKIARNERFFVELLFSDGDYLSSDDHLGVFGLVSCEPFKEGFV